MSQSKSIHENSNFQARRNLLKMGGACGAMTNMTFLSTLAHLKMTNAVMADSSPITPTGGYKALVCLFFNGAIDSFNVLTPHGTTQEDQRFAEYAATRTGAALKRRDPTNGIDDGDWVGTDYGYLNPIADSASAGGTGRIFGLHPRFTYLKQIYDAGHATFVANCGSLVHPILNNGEFALTSKIKPIGLYSHPDLQRHWQTAIPTTRNQVKGWAGKMMDLMTAPGNSASDVYSAISTSGQSLLLTGDRISSYTIGAITATSTGGSTPLSGINGTASYDRVYTGMQTDYASQVYADVLERTIRNNRAEARDAASALNTVWGTTALPGSPAVQFPTSGLGSQLASVAKAIKIAKNAAEADPLHQERQVFMCTIGGWDHHASLINTQNTMIPAIDTGLKAFYDFLVAEGLLSNVTLFTISDFARTWSFNGSGSDHAWGGNPFVMGGAVNATAGNNRIWGTYPNIVLDTSSTGIDRGRGVVIPQTSTDLYHAEICRWFGVPDNRLVDVLPNIGNFNYQGASGHPVGFLNFA